MTIVRWLDVRRLLDTWDEAEAQGGKGEGVDTVLRLRGLSLSE
jgi:hypothetical protein